VLPSKDCGSSLIALPADAKHHRRAGDT